MNELVKKAKLGDKKSFTDLMILIKQDLYKISKIRLSNNDDIADAIQNTMLIAFTSIKNLKNTEYFKTWIIRILINECNKIYRQKKRTNYISLNDNEDKLISSNDINLCNENLNIDFLCKHLKHEERIVIFLYYGKRYTDKEIGQILKTNENTIKTRRLRAIKKIQKLYGKEFSYE